MDSFIVYDLETTGIDPLKNEIIEIGALKVCKGVVVDTFSCFINPHIPLPREIVALTGITQSMVEGGLEKREAIQGFLDFASEDTVLGHNISFDYKFMKAAADSLFLPFEKKTMDTLKIARKHLKDLPDRKLGTLCSHYGYVNEHAHRALDDAMATYHVYEKMKEAFFEADPESFVPQAMKIAAMKEKKVEPMTLKQKKYLSDLVSYHRLKLEINVENLSKSEASKLIDSIILHHGKIYQRRF
ncbi:MAG: 3'-5' exoribonuclease [Lachnospiraceae bacterium]|nr:3'-5' exoribonuclease [Lachnospiraceae bacterium]